VTVLNSQLEKIVNKIKDRTLKKKVIELIENPTIQIEGEMFTGLPLNLSPAGLSRHHSYEGGLIEHIVATSEIALCLCNVAKKVYRGHVNRDLVLAGVVLHDVFKSLTYQVEENGTYRMSALGERLDHLTLMVAEMIRRGSPLDLVHIVCAHHGGEAGPIWPKTVEALICHLADLTDSRLNGEILRAARYLSRRATGEEFKLTTSKEAFEIVESKAIEGWEGVKKVVEKIMNRKMHASRS
jgi:7,8-dihydroneopterin 2',3'-cyclic phosphate phosphodiesterase